MILPVVALPEPGDGHAGSVHLRLRAVRSRRMSMSRHGYVLPPTGPVPSDE
jgi:hypothetical protein